MTKQKEKHIYKEIIKFYWRSWNYRLFKERVEIKSILRFIKNGDIAVDIGAYKGAYTYWMSKAVGAAGKVYAFEPQKHVYNSLLNVLNRIKTTNIILEPKGLSSKIGEMDLAIPGQKKGFSPGATFEIKYNEKYQDTYTVQVNTLDNYFEKTDGKISFIKCDVEGHELHVFRGGINIIKSHKPVLLFECEQRHLRGHSVVDVFTFIEQLGYEGYFIYRNQLQAIRKFQINTHQIINKKPYANNFLFLPNNDR